MAHHQNNLSELAYASSRWNAIPGGPTAPVERAHSDRARSGSSGPHEFSQSLPFSLWGVAWLNP